MIQDHGLLPVPAGRGEVADAEERVPQSMLAARQLLVIAELTSQPDRRLMARKGFAGPPAGQERLAESPEQRRGLLVVPDRAANCSWVRPAASR